MSELLESDGNSTEEILIDTEVVETNTEEIDISTILEELSKGNRYFILSRNPMIISGIALVEGRPKEVFYAYPEIKKSKDKLLGADIIAEHYLLEEYGTEILGEVTKTWTDDRLKALLFAAKITNDAAIADIESGRFKGVSVFARFDRTVDNEALNIWYPNLSLVEVPACETCLIVHKEYLSKSYNKLIEEEKMAESETEANEQVKPTGIEISKLPTEKLIDIMTKELDKREDSKSFEYTPPVRTRDLANQIKDLSEKFDQLRESLTKPEESTETETEEESEEESSESSDGEENSANEEECSECNEEETTEEEQLSEEEESSEESEEETQEEESEEETETEESTEEETEEETTEDEETQEETTEESEEEEEEIAGTDNVKIEDLSPGELTSLLFRREGI